jgi:hypothetical protein
MPGKATQQSTVPENPFARVVPKILVNPFADLEEPTRQKVSMMSGAGTSANNHMVNKANSRESTW